MLAMHPNPLLNPENSRQLMREYDAPVDNGIALVALLHKGKVQILKVAIVEEERVVGIESNCAAGVVVVDVQRVWRESVSTSAVEQDGGEEAQGGCVGLHEFLRGRAFSGDFVGQEDADVCDFGNVSDVVSWLGVAVTLRLFYFVHRGLADYA